MLYEWLHGFGVMLPYLGIAALGFALYLRRTRALVASGQLRRTYALEALLVLAFIPLASVHCVFLTFAGLPADGLVGMYVLGVLVTASLASLALLAWNFQRIDRGLAALLSAPRALEKSRDLLAGVLTSSRDGMMVFDAVRDARGTIIDFAFEAVNPAAEAVVGRSADDLLGKRMLDELPGNKKEGLFDAYCGVVETGDPYHGSFFYDYDGITAYFENTAVRRGDGFAVTFRDVTAYKTTEHALRRSEARLRNITDSAPDAIILSDAEGRIIDWNQGAEALFGLAREEALGTALERLMPERLREGHALGMARRRQTGESRVIGTPVELTGLRRSGEEFPLELALSSWTEGDEPFYTGIIRDITERKAAEAALHESQELFRTAFEDAAIGKALVGPEGQPLQVNQTLCAMLGYTEAEMLGMDFTEFTHREDIDLDVEQFMQLTAGEIKSYELEKRYLHRDGHVVWGLLSVARQVGADGQVLHLIAEVQDITVRKQTEAEVQESAERLQLLLQATSDSSESLSAQIHNTLSLTTRLLGLDIGILSRVEGETYAVENVYAPGTDLAPGQTFDLGQTYCAITLDCDDVVAIDHMERSEHRGHPCYEAFGLEAYLGIPVCVDGEVYGTLNFSSAEPPGTPFSEQDRDFVRLLGLWVTHAVERRRAGEALRASESRFRSAFKNAAIGKGLLDTAGRFLRVNPALCGLLGYGEEELLARSFQEMTHPDDLRCSEARLEDLLSGAIDSFAVEKRYLHRDGHPVWSLFSVAAVTGTDGAVEHLVAEVVDITARKQADQIKNDFISMVSHELRTPLTSIAGSLRLISAQATGEVPAPTLRLLDIAGRNSDRLVRLINDLLDVQRIEAGKMELELGTLPLGALLDAAVEANEGYGARRGVVLCLRQAAPDAHVVVDPDRFMQIMANLISNAVKFSPPEGSVEVVAEEQDGLVRIAVTDHGEGIPEAFRARLFDKFAQADSSDTRKKDGSGLGLALTKSLVELHGGTLRFETELGEGTTFFVELPPAAAVPALHPAHDRRPAVLVVEDNFDVAHLLNELLTQNGFRVDIASSARQARARVAERAYVAATLDLRLPDADGVELLREWGDCDFPVIVVSVEASERRSALGDEALAGDGTASGDGWRGGALPVADWFDKPFSEDQLLDTVQRVAASPAARILHVEDDLDCAEVTATLLAQVGAVVQVGTLAEARAALAAQRFDLAILDLGLPDGDGLDLLPLLKETETPVAICSARATDAEAAQRAVGHLVKGPVDHAELLYAVCSAIGHTAPDETEPAEPEPGPPVSA